MGPLEAAFLWRRLQAALSRKPCYGPFPPMRLTFHLRSSFRVLPLVASSCPVLRLILRRMMRNCRSFGDYFFFCAWLIPSNVTDIYFYFVIQFFEFYVICHVVCTEDIFLPLLCLSWRRMMYNCFFSITSNSEIDLGIFSHVIIRRVICPTCWLKFCTDFIEYLILKVCYGRIFHSQNCGLDVMGT